MDATRGNVRDALEETATGGLVELEAGGIQREKANDIARGPAVAGNRITE